MNALLRARPIDPENSFFKVNPGLSKREALDEISAHRKQVDRVLFELVPGLREDVERTDRESYLEWKAREREVKDALGGDHV